MRCLWVWAASGVFSSVVAVLQNFTTALAAGLLLHSLRHGIAAGTFQLDSSVLRQLEAAFLACGAWKLLRFVLPLVNTYRKGELTGSGFNEWGDHGMGWTLCNHQLYNDDVALSLADAAGASVLKSFANKFAQAHVKTAKAPMLALKTANSQADRLLVGLITTKVPLSAQLVLQGFILKVGRGGADMSQGELVILLNMLVGICLGILDVMSVKDFEAMVRELVAAVEASKRIGLWQRNDNDDAAVRERAYSQIFILRWLVRLSAVLVVLCSGVALWCIVTVLRTYGARGVVDGLLHV
uniref:Uncharacterized protein n=1 Tax=Alexandrium catenella TaxID=2925 RepID=A0A7S1S5J0_ALECA